MKAEDSLLKKIRVIYTTDMRWDDENTLIRILLFANDQNIIGITPRGGPWQDQISNEPGRIRAKIDIYDNLKLHDPDYPSPEYLCSITVTGNLDYDDYSVYTEGSMLIANTLLDETDGSPVWVTCWGEPVTVTAVLRYINDNFPEKKTYVTNVNYNQNHGALAKSFQWKNSWNDDVDGDALSVLQILGSAFGLRSTEYPTSGGWGSRFESGVNDYKAHVNHSADGGVVAWEGSNKLSDSDKNVWLQKRSCMGARWADDFQNELTVRADWCIKSYSEANHPPIVNLAISVDITAAPGQTIHLLCNPTDPNGDSISCNWWQYKEAGTSGAAVDIDPADKSEASFVCPDEPGAIHIIPEVQDEDPEHPLTRYARVIAEVKEERSKGKD
jgi:hypothetical protein